MIAERVFDERVLFELLKNKTLLSELLESNSNPEDINFNTDKDCVLKISDGDLFIGVYILTAKSRTLLDMHPMIMPEHRGLAEKSMKSVFRWIEKNCDESVKKIIATFPITSRNVTLFALRCGFKKEGVNRMSFEKDGVLIDQLMVGITREEIRGVL